MVRAARAVELWLAMRSGVHAATKWRIRPPVPEERHHQATWGLHRTLNLKGLFSLAVSRTIEYQHPSILGE